MYYKGSEIISGAVILLLTYNNKISEADEVVFKIDLNITKSEYTIYIASQYAVQSSYNPSQLNANDLSITYAGEVVEEKTIKENR